MTSSKRTKKIEIRLTEAEYEQLLLKRNKPKLAQWIREYCLEDETIKVKKNIPKSDSSLLIALARIDNSLNHVIKNIYSDDQMTVKEKEKHLKNISTIGKDIRKIKNAC